MFSSVAGLGTNSSKKTSSSKGIGGLVSGINTDDIIKKLTALSQSKIDSAVQQKQKIQWKQTAYQDIITKINNLKSSFFDVTNPTSNLSSSSAFNTWSVSSSSSAVTVSSSTTNTGEMLELLSIDSLAVANSFESGSAVSGGIIATGAIGNLTGKEMKVTLDGVTKTITFSADAQADLNTAFGLSTTTGQPRVKLTDNGNGTFSISTNGTSKLSISGDADTLATVGLKSGASNLVDITKSLGDTSFKTALVGGAFSFTINGVDFNFTSSDSVMKVINTVNSSNAGVKMAYSETDDKFTLTSTTAGTGSNITASQLKGNLLSAMFGFATDKVTEVASPVTYAARMVAQGEFVMPASGWEGLNSKSFDITVNNVKRTLTVPSIDYTKYSTDAEKAQAVLDSLNSQLKSAYGNSDVQFSLNSKTIELTVKNNKPVSLNTVDSEGKSTEALDFLHIANKTNNSLTTSSTLSSLGLSNGTLKLGATNEVITYDGTTTIESLLGLINAKTATTGITASFADGKLALKSDGTNQLAFSEVSAVDGTLTGNLAKTFFGVYSYTPTSINAAAATAGQNAVITLKDGTKIERNSNSFNVSGINVQLNETYSNADPTKSIAIRSTQNLDDIVKTVKSFVEAYNAMAASVKTKLTEDVNKDYLPLTDAQRTDMSESQVKLWEDKAKSGILKNDRTVNAMLDDFYDVLVSGSSNSPYSLESIGLTTSVSTTEGTKLVFNEEKFREMLTKDHEGVTRLFTDPTDGFSDKLSAAIDKYGSSSVVSTGALVEIAGTSVYKDSQENQQLTDIDEKIADLKVKLTAEETKLWKQFSAMETALSQLNSQASWLTSLNSQQ